MDSRVPPVRRAVILAAGKSTRLGGANKLLVEAGGAPAHEWHERLLRGIPTTIITRSEDRAEVAAAATWAEVIAHPKFDGPVGALSSYVEFYGDRQEELLVLFGDTLLVPQPLPTKSWVGIALAPARVWDLPSPWGWARGKIALPVCVGIYSFDQPERLKRAIGVVMAQGEGADLPMVKLLNEYRRDTPLSENLVRGWYDAGDAEALRRVPDFSEVLLEDPTRLDTIGFLDLGLTR